MDTITTAAPVNPLRQRMQHDMMMRGPGSHTQQDYIRHVRRFAAFLGRPPDAATADDLRNFQIHQHERGASASTINRAVSALRFFYAVTLKRQDLARGCSRRHQALSTRRRWAWPKARACGFQKSPTSSSMTLTASGC